MATKATSNPTIEIEYEGKTYTLEFDRASIERAERVLDFTPKDIQEISVTGMTNLVHAAFIKHHNRVSRNLVNEIIDNINDKEELFTCLSEMYGAAFSTLTEDVKGEAKASWKKM